MRPISAEDLCEGSFSTFDEIAELFAALCVSAAPVAMDIFGEASPAVRTKKDGSRVTEADERVEALLVEELGRRLPRMQILAEEAMSRGGEPPRDSTFVAIDALDGTEEFLSKNVDFTINVGLVVHGEPRAGAVYAPALGEIWWGGTNAFSAKASAGAPLPSRAHWRSLRTRRLPSEGRIALVSRRYFDEGTKKFLAELGTYRHLPVGASLKFCRIAEGAADIYPRIGPTMEWDTAAGHAVLRAAGGSVLELQGQELRYGKRAEGYRNSAFVAYGDSPAKAS